MTKAWIKTTLILYVLWILLSGKFEAKFIIVGLISSAIIAKLCVSSFWIPDKKNEQTYSLLNIPVFKLIRYIVWLLVEIIKASWE